MTTNFHAARVERLEGERAGLLAERARLTEERNSFKAALEAAERVSDIRNRSAILAELELRATQAELAEAKKEVEDWRSVFASETDRLATQLIQANLDRVQLESELAALKAQWEGEKESQ